MFISKCDLCKSQYWENVVRKYRIISSDYYVVTENHIMNLCEGCVRFLTQEHHVKLKELREMDKKLALKIFREVWKTVKEDEYEPNPCTRMEIIRRLCMKYCKEYNVSFEEFFETIDRLCEKYRAKGIPLAIVKIEEFMKTIDEIEGN